MEPCHSASTRSPALTSACTVAHLIRNIEQLKNKDKLISQLEKDLGHQWVAAQLAALERDACEGGTPGSPVPNPGWNPGPPSQPATPSALPKDSQEPTTFTRAPSSTPERGGVEDEWPTSTEGPPHCKHDLQKLKERNKELLGKCRAYLQRTKELTAQNRAYKDSSHKVLQENKKMQELLEHSKMRILQLSREVTDAHAEQDSVENQSDVIHVMRREMVEDKKTIHALKQACSEKDRRIELIQHRKKRRRLAGPENKNMGMKETFFGYEEDANSMDSEASFSSLSQSTLSDEDLWDDVMSREETERNYQRLMLEHLQLQKSHALLQKTIGHLQDPQREERTKYDLQNDLFEAQCKIEKLEKMVNEIGEGEVTILTKERESSIERNRNLQRKIELYDTELHHLRKELTKANERADDLEFQLIELENTHDDFQNQKSCDQSQVEEPSSCADSDTPAEAPSDDATEVRASLGDYVHNGLEVQSGIMDQLRKDLAAVLKGKGKDAEATLKKYDKVAEDEKKRSEALESMARELQKKVVVLQQERDDLQEQVNQKGKSQQSQKSKKGKEAEASMSARAREKQENLELMAEISGLIETQDRLLQDKSLLQDEIDDWKTQFSFLKQQLDLVTRSSHASYNVQSGHSSYEFRADMTSESNWSAGSTPPNLSPPSTLTRKNSKDRKSRPRSGDDPTETKRRKSSNYKKPEENRMDDLSSLSSYNNLGVIVSGNLQLKNTSSQCFRSVGDIQTMTEAHGEIHDLRQRMSDLERELQQCKHENVALKEQLKQSALEKSCEAEADQQILLDKLIALENETSLLKRENTMLAERLRQRHEDLNDSQEEINPKVAEMEEYCADLQDRLWSAQAAERHAKEKLRLLESSIDELEACELVTRQKYEDILARETETKKQTRELYNTCQDLKEIVLDKDIVEQALRDKVDFLQKAEAASVKRIDELEAVEKELRAELERYQQMDSDELSKSSRQRELNKIQELRHQMTFLETDNRALSARVAELEENEETLRENWQRVAEEDYKRMQGLEEKVKSLESQNAELKLSLKDAEECIVISTVSSVDNSLAAELAQSQSKGLAAAREYDGSIDAGSDAEPESLDPFDGGDSDSQEGGWRRQDSEKRKLRDRLNTLERQLSDAAEKKNTAIESLQEKIVDLKENEIKLSETISEMEMTEREIRAKLALYESSEVTVEKMLKYQSKIEELRTSQESLLDQIESMENQEMTMQEKMQEMERTLRGKIVTLEVEMKGFKQKELKDAAKIRELEKQEKELSEKTAQQAEKENGLYIKISSLMDEVKALKEELETTKTQLADKEDKVRKAKLLDVKFLEIEMEFSKKMNDLSTKLRHKEEELRQKEVAHEEEIAILKEELSAKEAEYAKNIATVEKTFDAKEMEWHHKLTAIEESVKELTNERDEYEAQISDLRNSNQVLEHGQSEYDIVMMTVRKELESFKAEAAEKETKLALAEENLEKEKSKSEVAQNRLLSLQEELETEKNRVEELRHDIQCLQDDMADKIKSTKADYIEKCKDAEKQRDSLQSELKIKNEKLEELSAALENKSKRICELESECEALKLKSEDLEKKAKNHEDNELIKVEKVQHLEYSIAAKELSFSSERASLESKCVQLEQDLSSKEANNSRLRETLSQKEKEHSEKISSLLSEQKALESELRNKVMFLNTQLSQEVSTLESEKSNVKQLELREESLASEVASLHSEIEGHNITLANKESELKDKEKECHELSFENNELKRKHQELDSQFGQLMESSESEARKLQELIEVKDGFLEDLRGKLSTAQREMDVLHNELSKKDQTITESKSESNRLLDLKQVEIDQLLLEKAQQSTVVEEHIQKSQVQLQQFKSDQENVILSLKSELAEKESVLEQRTAEKSEMDAQIEDLQSQIQTLELYLSEVNAKLDIKSQAYRKLEQETDRLKQEQEFKSAEVLTLQKEVEAKREQVVKTSSQHSESLSVVSVKQQELEKTRTELKKCLDEIEQYKIKAETKQKEVDAQDQAHKQLTEEFEELSQQYQSKDQNFQQLEEKMTGVELKLKEAENRYRELESKCESLEMQLEERFAEAQKSEEIFKEKVMECQNLTSKLAESEAVEAELKSCEQKVQEYRETQEEKVKTIESLETTLDECKRKLKKVQQDFHTCEDERDELQRQLLTVEEQLKESSTEINELRATNSGLEAALEEKETFCRDSQSGLSSLEQQHLETQIECQNLRSKVAYFQQMHSHSQSLYEETEEKLKDVELSLDNSRVELLQCQNQLSETETAYNELASKYDISEEKLKTAQEELENLQMERRSSEQVMEIMKNQKSTDEAKLEQTNAELENKTVFCQKLQSELSDLKVEIKTFENDLKERTNECEVLSNDLKETKERNSHVESELSKAKSSNESLLSSNNEEITVLQNKCLQLETDVNSKSERITELEMARGNLVEHIQTQNNSLKSKLLEAKNQIVSIQGQMQHLEESNAALNSQAEADQRIISDQTEKLESAEKTARLLEHEKDDAMSKSKAFEQKCEGYESENVSLHGEIENLSRELQKTKDSSETIVKEMKEKEKRISIQKDDLENKEKELLEQIADIESSVIVPLEAENQELKDELAMVKQERDEAMCKSDKQKDLGDREDTESLRKSLEDALFQREELEKKLDILCSDIEKIEAERDSLKKQVTELKTSREENLERIEALECDLERLQKLEKQSSVVEEAETRLMDRVLDLEESERILTVELNNLKNKKLETQTTQTEEDAVNDELLERLQYLEQKNEVLQDAESRYMDKIIELEKTNQQQQLLQPQADAQKFTTPHSENENLMSFTHVSATHTTQTSVPYSEAFSPGADNNSSGVVETCVMEEASQVSTNPTNLVDSGGGKYTDDLNEVKTDIIDLSNDCDEKSKKIAYLEEKLELLRDSEARLMEKLLEAEENVGKATAVSDTNKQIESLAEENEYLAQTVENYKELYRVEKEKNSELNDRLMEDSSLAQELQQTRLELISTQRMVEDLQSEYEDQLAQKEQSEEYMRNLLEGNQEKIKELESDVDRLECSKKELSTELNSQQNRNGQINQSELLSQLESLRDENKESQSQHAEREKLLQEQIFDYSTQMSALEERLAVLRQEGSDLQAQVIALKQRETDLVRQVESLSKQLHNMQTVLENRESHEVESVMSDSGLSADGQKSRHGSTDKEAIPQPASRSVVQETFQSTASISLTNTSAPSSRKSSITQSPSPSPTPPVAPPRRGRSRPTSIDSISQEELIFLVEELQNKEAALRKRNRELETLVDLEATQRVKELEERNQDLEQQLTQSQNQLITASSAQGRPATRYFFSEDDGNDGNAQQPNLAVRQHYTHRLNRSFSPSFFSGLSSSPVPNMLEKPEDVLNQRIKELENLDKHNKNQLSELERDREVLHEIARKDKATIHDMNVKIRELQLSERSLKEQVNSLEVSESSLYSKCEDLEAVKAKLEDRVHELEIHERRLRELVRKLKLDEERWLSKSGGFESAVAELSANEHQLKRLLQDTEMEKGGLVERAEYLEARIRELESVEATLIQRLKSYENNEISLQNRLVHLENSEAAAHSKASELDVMNADLSQRLQKLVEENGMLSQHVSQLHGQIQELDRRLLASRDSEMAYKQHVESLQKNESSLQKKVREFELREIDSQARVRELEQTQDITNDKLATLQRSENRLKFRVQELEGIGGQIPGDLTPAQRQKVPQKLEDCQKRIVALQEYVENLQSQLRETLKSAPKPLASKDGADNEVSISEEEYSQLQTKSVLLEETMYQLEEVENVNTQLNETILQLRDGKGASGHEVEIEVLKRRLASYKAFVHKLKSSLSTGQATSLLDPELDSGPQGETLPTRSLHGLASERVLQSVRGLPQGKADTPMHAMGGANCLENPRQDVMFESKTTLSLSSQTVSLEMDGDHSGSDIGTSRFEESHWKAIEARKPTEMADSRGGVKNATTVLAENQQQSGFRNNDGRAGIARKIFGEEEEVTVGLHLPSESELSSHYVTTQNDTDSSASDPVPPPRKGRLKRTGAKNGSTSLNNNNQNEGSNDSRDAGTSAELGDVHPATYAVSATATNENIFVNSKSLPLSAINSNRSNAASSGEQTRKPPLKHFADDSFYLPSSAQEGVDSLDDDEAPPLPSSRPPGAEDRSTSGESVEDSVVGQVDQERRDSLENSTSGMSIRERIAMIEKQLQSDQFGSKTEGEQVLYWKNQATESMKQVDVLEKDNKFLREDINRLEKELEEKRRFINLLEQWLSSIEDLLKNKTKQTDREMIENLQHELSKLRSDLKRVGYRSEDAMLDPAALKTELEHRDKEIASRRNELESLSQELKKSREECRSIESMRRTALDSLRALEQEVIGLQAKAKQLDVSEKELGTLKTKYDELDNYKSQAVNMIQPLQAKVERLAKSCQEKNILLRRLGDELRGTNYRPSSALDDLTRMEQTMEIEESNTDFPPLTNGVQPPQRPERKKAPSRSSSMDELDMSYQHHSDTELSSSLPYPRGSNSRALRSHYVNNRPKSADPLSSDSASRRHRGGAHAQSRSTSFGAAGVMRPEGFGGGGRGQGYGQFVAIADYDPSMFSQSGRPRLELELREGDHVIVIGPMDRSGYYEAEVKGRAGLVPANYLQPLHGGGHMARPSTFMSREAFIPSSVAKETQAKAISVPSPPRNLHVKACVGDKSILLSWLPPKLDSRGCTNGLKVLGYMVYVDHKEYEQIPNVRTCEVVVEDLRPDQASHMAVQCLCAGGFASPKTELIFQGIAQMATSNGNVFNRKEEAFDESMDTDLSSVLNSAHYKRGHRKTMMALYDYNPELQTPHDYTALELAFHAGDIIHVYGEPRADGFYHGEIDGHRGLVPACFVEDVSKMSRPSQRLAGDVDKQASQA